MYSINNLIIALFIQEKRHLAATEHYTSIRYIKFLGATNSILIYEVWS